MAEKNSVRLVNSRYVSGGVTEVNRNALEWWERNTFAVDPSDIVYIVERKFEGRIDLIANTFLDEPRYWWVIGMLNNILDPHLEIREGTRLFIPSKERVKNLLNGTTGGVPSTREVPLSVLPIV